MQVYMQRIETKNSVSGEELVELVRRYGIREEVPMEVPNPNLYKLYFQETSNTQKITLPLGKKLLSAFHVPVYIFFPIDQKVIDLLAFDFQMLRSAIHLVSRPWSITTGEHLSPTAIPENMEIEGVVKAVLKTDRLRKGTYEENYDDLPSFKEVCERMGTEGLNVSLREVEVSAGRTLDAGRIRLYTVTLKTGYHEFELKLDQREVEQALHEREGKFISSLMELIPLFYSGNPEDLRKVCFG